MVTKNKDIEGSRSERLSVIQFSYFSTKTYVVGTH